MSPRRKSVDSSSSSSSSSSDSSSDSDSSHKEKTKKDKKSKKGKKDKDHKSGNNSYLAATATMSGFPSPSDHSFNAPSQFPHTPPHGGGAIAPPPYAGHTPIQHTAPPSGYRVPLTTTAPFPGPDQCGQPPFYDLDGVSPVFIGSALMERSVHPCKIGPHLQPYASVPYGSTEYNHHGRFDLLPFRHEQMEFVPTSHGRIPQGRRPVEGGYEEDGNKLYHAVAVIQGIKVPGKAGEHLNGARIAFGGVEYSFENDYEVLCWR